MTKIRAYGAASALALVMATGAYAQDSSNPTQVTISANATTNQAYIVQGIPGSGSNGNAATIDQTGSGNSVGKLGGTVTLYGDPTDVSLNNPSLSVFKQGGNSNTLNITQSGSNNEVLTASLFSPKSGLTPNSTANGSFQTGTGNTGNITQTGTYEKALLQQSGSYNTANIGQGDGTKMFAAVYQNSDLSGSTATINQTGSSKDYALIAQGGGSNNAATISQSGNYNIAALVQEGSSNAATISQAGNGIAAVGVQIGIGNNAYVNQAANVTSANAAFAQVGNNNSVTIRQH